MIETLLVINAVILLIYMSLGFALARQRQHLDTVDAAWGIGFVLVAWAVELQAHSLRSLVVALLVSVWGLRLSNHIWQRNQGRDDDLRYRELTAKWRGNLWTQAYVRIFLLQGVLIWLVSLPVVMTAGRQVGGRGWLTLIGGLVWLVGFSFEATADRQLRQFLASKNHPKLLQTGLWHYSRHPNYFGELVQWWGLGLIALQTSFGWVGLLGPALLSYLIIFVSGLPPIERRHQHDPLYQTYRSHTSALIPWPARRPR